MCIMCRKELSQQLLARGYTETTPLKGKVVLLSSLSRHLEPHVPANSRDAGSVLLKQELLQKWQWSPDALYNTLRFRSRSPGYEAGHPACRRKRYWKHFRTNIFQTYLSSNVKMRIIGKISIGFPNWVAARQAGAPLTFLLHLSD